MHICVYDDRPSAETSLKLLILSMGRHCPGCPIELLCARATDPFRQWLRQFPHVELNDRSTLTGRGWSIKPAILLEKLNEGHDTVLWIDSDILITRDFHPLFDSISNGIFVATVESTSGQYPGGSHRTVSWGLEVGRSMPCTINSAILRVGKAHRPLLEAWEELMEDPEYQKAQENQNWRTRPVHLFSDQEVLTALLGSADFADVPFRLLECDTEIIQQYGPSGYSVAGRLRNLVDRGPMFLHAQGSKPWLYAANPQVPSFWRQRRAYYNRLAAELSAYTAVAAKYIPELQEPASWTRPRTLVGRTFHAITGGHPTLQGLPQAVLDTLGRKVKRAMKLDRLHVQTDPTRHRSFRRNPMRSAPASQMRFPPAGDTDSTGEPDLLLTP
jgi:hypothetical protein